MKNIHLIPTSQPSRLHKIGNELGLTDKPNNNFLAKQQNLYITSDEVVKVGDWVIEFQKNDKIGEVHFINGEYVITKDIQKKIILTTDPTLITDGVQAIDDNFLEWFVKNPSCESLEIEKTQFNPVFDEDDLSYDGMTAYYTYTILIPKEEPKDVVLGYKTSLDAQILDRIEPKQETTSLEEAGAIAAGLCEHLEAKEQAMFIAGFQECAKYQAERMYSEEEVIAFTQWMYDYKGDINKVEELLKQFKKK